MTAGQVESREVESVREEQARRRLRQIQEVGRAVLNGESMEDALREVVGIGQQEPAWAAVAVVERPGNGELQVKAVAGDEGRLPVLSEEDWPSTPGITERQAQPGGRWLRIPLVGNQTALVILKNDGEPFDDDEKGHAQALGDCASMALIHWELRRQIERDTAARDHFFSMVNHDLKSPLANIKAQTDLLLRRLQRGKLDPATEEGVAEIVERLEQISQRTRELGRQIDDLVDVSRIESRRLAVHPVRENLAAVVTAAVEALSVAHPERAIELSVPPDPVWTRVDSTRFAQVVNHLIGNALRYSEATSGVQVSLFQEGRQACLEIRDQGAGIPPQQIPGLFHEYANRARSNAGHGGGGLGLGLYIAAGIVQAHGGTIAVESEVGSGSTFTVSLPSAD